MKLARRAGIAVLVYLALVIAVESLVGVMGQRQAAHGVGPDEDWITLTTTGADGAAVATVIAGVEVDGHLYVAANHWPRAWYRRALRHPEVGVARPGGGAPSPHRAVPISDVERDRVARAYALPFAARLLTGFPPRAFLRLDPR